jgi:predicted DNA-binding protein YlxM (UPF0122 family)
MASGKRAGKKSYLDYTLSRDSVSEILNEAQLSCDAVRDALGAARTEIETLEKRLIVVTEERDQALRERDEVSRRLKEVLDGFEEQTKEIEPEQKLIAKLMEESEKTREATFNLLKASNERTEKLRQTLRQNKEEERQSDDEDV